MRGEGGGPLCSFIELQNPHLDNKQDIHMSFENYEGVVASNLDLPTILE